MGVERSWLTVWILFLSSSLGQWAFLEDISETANAILEHGEAYAHYFKYFGGEMYCSSEHFQEMYIGCYKNREDWASSVWENYGMLHKIQDIGVEYSEINWDAVANNLEGDYILVDAGYHELYVFLRN